MTYRYKRFLRMIIITLVVIAIDQFTKQYVVDNFNWQESKAPIGFLSDYFEFTYVKNTGAAFGIFSNAGNLFLILSVSIATGMLIFSFRIPEAANITHIGMSIVCGGAIGNAIDRIRYDYVVDFVHLQIPGIISNVSNIADHSVVFGVALMIFDNWRLERMKNQNKDDTEIDETPAE